MMRRVWLLALLLVFPACSGVDEGSKVESGGAVTSTPLAPTTTAPAAAAKVVGDKVALKNGDTVQVYSYAWPVASSSQFVKAKPGMQYAVIDVEGCAKAASSFGTINPFSFALAMPDNTRLTPNISPKEPTLHAGAQAAGDCIRGFVGFEVPIGTKPLAVVFDDFATSVKWSIP